MRSRDVLWVLLVAAGGRVYADDAPPALPPQVPPQTPVAGPAESTRAGADARKAGDQAALTRLVGDGGMESLEIVDAALADGDVETAKALAAATPEPFTKPFSVYVEGRVGHVHPKAIGSLHELAKRLLAAQRTKDAARVYGRSAGLASDAGIALAVVVSRIFESRALLASGAAAASLAAADLAIAAVTPGPAAVRGPTAQDARGNALVALDRDADAIDAYAAACAGHRATDEPKWAAEALRRIGEQHARKGRLKLARSSYEAAVEVARPTGDPETLGGSLNALAMVLDDFGDMAGALTAYGEARALFEKGGLALHAAIADLNIGASRLTLDDDVRALDAFTRSRDAFQRVGERGYEMQALANIATVNDRAGRHAEALDAYDRVLAFALETKDAQLEMRTQGNRGLALRGLGRREESLAASRSQLALARRLGLPEFVMGALIFEARLHEIAGRRDEALATFRAASEVGGAGITPATRLRIEAGIAMLLIEGDDATGALAAVRRALDAGQTTTSRLSEAEGAQAREHLSALFDVGVEAAQRVGDAGTVVEMIEHGRAGTFRESMAMRRVANDAPTTALTRELDEATKAETASLGPYREAIASGQRSGIRDARAGVEAASRRVDDVRAQIERRAKASSATTTDDTVEGVARLRARLLPGEILVLWSVPRGRRALAVVVRPEDVRVVRLSKSADVEALVEAALGSGGEIDVAKFEELRRLVVTPLALPETARRVLVSPDGPLWTIPLSMLFPGLDVAAVPSGTVLGLLRDASDPRGEGVLALGDPSYPAASNLPPLVATRAEVERVGTVRLLGADATKARLLEALVSRPRWLALHLATHGLLDEAHPLRSALAFAPDASGEHRWTAAEVLTARIRADVVVLSACESGRGRHYRAEGVLGLARSFLLAGAPRVVASLWKVDDAATSALMVRFYDRFAPKEGVPVDASTALRLAQDDIGRDPRWKAPRYSAAWILIGLP